MIPGWPIHFLTKYSELPDLHDASMEQCQSESDDDDGDDEVTMPENELRSLRNLVKRMEVSTYSTAFSGIDSPGTAFAQLRAALCSMLGLGHNDMIHPKHLHAIDSYMQ